jgi:hypothetical protein
MTGDEKIVAAVCREAAEYGADVVGYLPAYMLIGCPSELADDERGFSSKEGSFIVLGLSHDPENPEMVNLEICAVKFQPGYLMNTGELQK